MITCTGCREQQATDSLCLRCVEDLNAWLRDIPVLYAELGFVRLPGSVPSHGGTIRAAATGSAAPVRLVVVDLLDRGETLARLKEWTDVSGDVLSICDGFRRHLLTICGEEWAGRFWRSMRALCRDLGRAVGEHQEQSIGKCSQLRDGEQCRGRLFRADLGGVYCKRCGDKPQIVDQQVWVTANQAATIVGKPIKTVRNWFNRGLVGWSPSVAPGLGWLPIIVRRAAVTTVPQLSDSVNPGSRAEPSVSTGPEISTAPLSPPRDGS